MMSHVSNQRKNGHLRKVLPLLLVMSGLLGGCVFSIYPWYAPDTDGLDPTLLGVWSVVDSENTWTFTEADSSMNLLAREDGDLGEFSVVAFNHGAWHFMDLDPTGSSLGEGSVAWHLLPTHGLYGYSLSEDTLRILQLKANLLWEKIEEIQHPPLYQTNNRWIFAGSSVEMAAFVEAQLLDSSLYEDHMVLVRQ